MLISYMTKMMVMFGVIIVVGLFLTWVNDGLEHLFRSFRPRLSNSKVTVSPLQARHLTLNTVQPKVTAVIIPKPVREIPVASVPAHNYASKIVKIDLAPRSRPTQGESGDKLGEHVTVLPKAA